MAGKQKLQKSALAEAQKVMTSETGKKCVEELLFTSFVTQ
ncbi:flagellar basal body-associated FliL family protein [Xanthomonas axonopodis]|nr:flagellar basal body-associated FliL family protein [Xanthomonas axonopodis]